MPRISEFLGIIIFMQYRDHNPPHFHAKYQNYEASFNFKGAILAGDMPPKQIKYIKAWTILYEESLKSAWKSAKKGETPAKIEKLPL